MNGIILNNGHLRKSIRKKYISIKMERLSWNTPSASSGYDEYTSDPSKPVPYTEDVHLNRTREYMDDDQRFASRRPDVLVFQSPILNDDVTLAGPLYADLFTSISTTDADFIVKLIDVFPDKFSYHSAPPNGINYPMQGYQMLVRGEVMRGKFRKSLEKPEAFTPNKVEEVKYYMPDVGHTFKKGHRIMVQVQSSWFPLVDRNPQKFVNIYEADASDFQKAQIKIYHNEKYPSSVILPVLKLNGVSFYSRGVVGGLGTGSGERRVCRVGRGYARAVRAQTWRCGWTSCLGCWPPASTVLSRCSRSSLEKKPGSNQPRTLLVPSVRDRVLQTAAARQLSRSFEDEFLECSYAYRPGRSVDRAIARIRELHFQGFEFVVDADIQAFFDDVDTDLLFERLQPVSEQDPHLAALLRQWIRGEVWDGHSITELHKGIPQGSPISPLLANYFLKTSTGSWSSPAGSWSVSRMIL